MVERKKKEKPKDCKQKMEDKSLNNITLTLAHLFSGMFWITETEVGRL